jgi:Planctomycete cytochrome C
MFWDQARSQSSFQSWPCAGFAQDSPNEFFEKRIRPVLSARCYTCHSDTKLGALQLTSRAALLAGGKSGPAITPGNSETSLLIRAIRQSDPKLKMPMAGEKLTEQEIADFRSWVQAGAQWPETGVAKAGFHITSSSTPRPNPVPTFPAYRRRTAAGFVAAYDLPAVERDGGAGAVMAREQQNQDTGSHAVERR